LGFFYGPAAEFGFHAFSIMFDKRQIFKSCLKKVQFDTVSVIVAQIRMTSLGLAQYVLLSAQRRIFLKAEIDLSSCYSPIERGRFI
jgi:hypothetical protein